MWEGLVHAEDIKATNEAWIQAFTNNTVYEMPHRIQMKDGSYRWHLSRGLPQKNEAGEIISWYGTATDIHEQKLQKKRLKKSKSVFGLL